jgi:hypothetical protein
MKKERIYGTAAENDKAGMADIRLPFTDRFVFMMVLMVRHIIVVLKTPSRIGDRIIDSRNIYDMMSVSPWFPAPDPPLAEFLTLITDYENAAAAVKTGKADSEADLHLAWETLNAARKLLLNYVQNVCVKNHDNAEKIALSAGMFIKKPATRDVQEFSVKAAASGGADLSAKVKEKRCAHEWQCTIDPLNPKSWYEILIPTTLQGKTYVSGFKPGTVVYFRHRTILKDGASDWDHIISLMIV